MLFKTHNCIIVWVLIRIADPDPVIKTWSDPVWTSRFEIHLNLNFSCSIYWSHDNTVRKYHKYWLLTEEKSKRSILLGKNKAEFGFSRRSNPDPGKALPAPQPCLLVTPTESKTLKASLISSSALISSNLRAIIPRKLGNLISFQLL